MLPVTPSVIRYTHDGVENLYVFVTGNDGHLYERHWNRQKWEWADRGTPQGTTVSSGSTVVESVQETANGLVAPLLYVFVRGADGHLHVCYWNGQNWTWAPQGMPQNTHLTGRPAAISEFRQPTGLSTGGLADTIEHIYVFVRGLVLQREVVSGRREH
jgi:hypothetical protein